MNIFHRANNNLISTSKDYDLEETLLYEKRYKYLINLYIDEGFDDLFLYLRHFYKDLLFSIRVNSLTQDRAIFTSGEIKHVEYVYTNLLIYRVKENISILDDLNLEKSKDFVYLTMTEKIYETLENNRYDNCMILPDCIFKNEEQGYLRVLQKFHPDEYELYVKNSRKTKNDHIIPI